MKFDDFKELGSEGAVKVKDFGNVSFKCGCLGPPLGMLGALMTLHNGHSLNR